MRLRLLPFLLVIACGNPAKPAPAPRHDAPPPPPVAAPVKTDSAVFHDEVVALETEAQAVDAGLATITTDRTKLADTVRRYVMLMDRELAATDRANQLGATDDGERVAEVNRKVVELGPRLADKVVAFVRADRTATDPAWRMVSELADQRKEIHDKIVTAKASLAKAKKGDARLDAEVRLKMLDGDLTQNQIQLFGCVQRPCKPAP